MPYIIQRVDDGKFVAPAGSQHSYVKDATRARQFATAQDAAADCCGNERIWYSHPYGFRLITENDLRLSADRKSAGAGKD